MKSLAEYRQEQKSLLDGASTGNQMPPRVSINGNKFTLIDPAKKVTEVPFLPDGPALDVVFVDRNEVMSKLFWGIGKAYNANEASPPLCFSDNGVAPSTQAMEPQSPLCATCPHNVIGSAISQKSGAKIRACTDMKKMAVVVKGFPGVFLFTIKPGSFKAWNSYTNWLRMQKLPDGSRPDLSDVVTRIRFVDQGMMSFTAAALTDNDEEMVEKVISIWETNKTNDATGMIVGRFDQAFEGVLPAPASQEALPVFTPPSPPPPPPQDLHPFTSPPPAPTSAPPPARGRGRPAAKKDERAPIAPPQPTQHGMQKAQTPPDDVAARLNSLFALPPAK